jgi:hypothetical protein
VREQVKGLGAGATAVQDAAKRAGIEVPAAVRASYEKAEQPEQYTALATALPRAATAVTAVGAAQRAAEQDRDPFSALGATLLGVDDRAITATALVDDGDYAGATAVADDATSRSGKALLVGLTMPLVLLLLLAGTALWAVAFVRSRARARAEHEARLAALAPLAPEGGPQRPLHPQLPLRSQPPLEPPEAVAPVVPAERSGG